MKEIQSRQAKVSLLNDYFKADFLDKSDNKSA